MSVSDRSIVLVVIKADSAQGHWPRLLHGKGKVTNIQVGRLPDCARSQPMCMHWSMTACLTMNAAKCALGRF